MGRPSWQQTQVNGGSSRQKQQRLRFSTLEQAGGSVLASALLAGCRCRLMHEFAAGGLQGGAMCGRWITMGWVDLSGLARTFWQRKNGEMETRKTATTHCIFEATPLNAWDICANGSLHRGRYTLGRSASARVGCGGLWPRRLCWRHGPRAWDSGSLAGSRPHQRALHAIHA